LHGLGWLLVFISLFTLFNRIWFSVVILLTVDLIELLEQLVGDDAVLVTLFFNIQIMLMSLKL